MNTEEIFWCKVCKKSQEIDDTDDDSPLISTKTCPDCGHTLILAKIGFNGKRFVVMGFALGFVLSLFFEVGRSLFIYTLTTLFWEEITFTLSYLEQVQLTVYFVFFFIGVVILVIMKITQKVPFFLEWDSDSADLENLSFKHQIFLGGGIYFLFFCLANLGILGVVFILVFLV